ncbi:hypothetical protein ILUMI_10044 [Ignelater luminosus]|uniref:Focadhesin n=1 Tax=Ignelater luminosus TaxID=2038154 RepID=A0A8K0GEH9_IGNLU|nr:hypothetical protein ILUMI_10044 [Ignelater luminosus]
MESSIRQGNPILTAQTISKLVGKIKDQQNNAAELKYLKEKCILSEDVVVSLTASKALVALIESETVQISSTLAELVSSLSLARSFVGITSAIGDLLQMDLRYKLETTEKYKCSFNLRAPQHPLISILSQKQEAWMDILNKINDFYQNENDKALFYANELLYPFYMYTICNPNNEVPELFQYKLWNFLIHGVNKDQSIDVKLYIIAWLQISKKRHVLKTSSFLIDMLQLHNASQNKNIKDVLILWLTSLVCELIKNDCDPRNVIMCLHDTLKSYDLEHLSSTMLVILANSILLCPSVYLHDLLILCKFIVLLNTSNMFAVQTIRISLLQWIAYGCSLTANSLRLANDILLHIENSNKYVNGKTKQLYSNKIFQFLRSTNKHVHIAVELVVLSESLTSKNILHWLNKADKLPVYTLKNMFNYFVALLLYEYEDIKITLKVIEILLKITDSYKELTFYLLILILCKLSNSVNSEVHFNLIKALPKMAVLKENLPLVLNTLEVLKKGMFNLKSFPITLYFDLWNTDVKCYPYLQNLLVSTCEKTEDINQWWEFHVAKAHALKQICLKRPEVHGGELVGHLSEILNKCSDTNGELPSALAIDGIKALCNAGIIDFTSTWNELSRRCNLEARNAVIKSLCNFMSEAAYFELSECPDKLLEDIITKLWYYATSHENIEVISAAFKALGCFTLEQVSPYLPDTFKSSDTDSGCSSFGLIYGECWIKLLMYNQNAAVDIIGDFLIKHISTEIAEYRSGTYTVTGHREPQNFSYLPEYSIVRALGNYIKKEVQKWQHSVHKHVYLQCLRILSQQYSKPLPPMDWCFLQELVHVPEARSHCITLASHQVQLSGTARRLVENYIAALTNMTCNDEDIRTVYKNLKYLCNSIQPITLRPFIETSLAFAMKESDNIENEQEELCDTLIYYLKDTLNDENLLESNRLVLSEIIVQTAKQLNTEQMLFTKLLDCIVVLPIRFIDELSSPRLWKEESSEQIKLSVKVRCALASKATVSPLTWLNDFIDAACFMPMEHDYVLRNIMEVMKFYRNSDFACSWILELLGHIQSTIANENTNRYRIQFLCDVYTLSVVVLAGQDIFILSQDDLIVVPEHRLQFFPYSLVSLLEHPNWKSCYVQISEWLYHMANYHETPENYKIVFYQSLSALRHEEGFEKPSKWMKYVGCRVNLDI